MGWHDGNICYFGLYRLYKSIPYKQMKRISHSRTMWFSLLLVVFGALFDNFSYVQNIIDPRYYGLSFVVIGIICAVLRFITTEPVK